MYPCVSLSVVLLLVSSAESVLWLPYSLYAGYVMWRREEEEEERGERRVVSIHTDTPPTLWAPASPCSSSSSSHHLPQHISASVILQAPNLRYSISSIYRVCALKKCMSPVHTHTHTLIFPINNRLCRNHRAGNRRAYVRAHFPSLWIDVITDGCCLFLFTSERTEAQHCQFSFNLIFGSPLLLNYVFYSGSMIFLYSNLLYLFIF